MNKQEFLEAVENNEYGEYNPYETDELTLITDVDSEPYVHCTGMETLMNRQTVDDVLAIEDGFAFRSVEYDRANSERETENCDEPIKIWQIHGFEVTE